LILDAKVVNGGINTDYGYSVHDDPAYSDRPIDQEAVAEFLHGTKDDFL